MYGNAFGGTLAFALLSFERERFPFRRIAKKSNLFLQLSSTPHVLPWSQLNSGVRIKVGIYKLKREFYWLHGNTQGRHNDRS